MRRRQQNIHSKAIVIWIFLFFSGICSARMNRIELSDGQTIFVSGMNLAWIDFARDLVDLDESRFDGAFAEISAAGGNTVRWWLHVNGNATPEFDSEGYVTGPGKKAIQNLIRVLDRAEHYHLKIILVLWSFDMLRPNWRVDVSRNRRLLEDVHFTRTYIDNALIPMVRAVKDHPAVLCWEICNEAAGMSQEHGWTPERVPFVQIQRFHNLLAGAIHRNAPGTLVTTGAWTFQTVSDIGSFTNRYTDEALIQAGNDSLGVLDFYEVHYYPKWHGEDHSPFHHPADYWKLDKPCIIGEFPAGGIRDIGTGFKPESELSTVEAFHFAFQNGYAGCVAWTWTGHDGYGGVKDGKPGMTRLKSAYAEAVVWKQKSPNYSITTLTPGQDAVLSDNTPILSWSADKPMDSYEIWIDDVCMAKTAGNRNRIIPFPLSFGSHKWYVAGILGERRIVSPVVSFSVEGCPAAQVPENAMLLRVGWQLASSTHVGEDGTVLSKADHSEYWYPTSVPVTVLSALVRNGVYPNPYVGKNNMRIPDLDDVFNNQNDLLQYSHIPGTNPWKQPYWFRREFVMDEAMYKPRIWLNLDEINYKADVWLNGVHIADSSAVKGMERRFRFDITDPVRFDTTNVLLIAVYPPDHPGQPSPPPLEITSHPGRNMGADGKISLDYTKWDALGWDWQPAVRDRDMGIIGDVYITTSGLTELQDLYVSADVILDDTLYADIRLSFLLTNYSLMEKGGVIRGEIKPIGYPDPPICFEWPVNLAPGESKEIILTPGQIEQLHLVNPKLWWPIQWGKADRYEIRLTHEDQGVVHEVRDVFGIRKVETYIGQNERIYRINGQDIYIKGGNWVLDMMLNWTPDRYVQEVALAANANMNLLRVWGPTGVPPDVFFRAADSLGVMIWQDFLNDFWGTFKNNPELKPDSALFEICTSDVVRRLRNHPSVVIWCGGNEGPNQYENMIMENILPRHDPSGNRHYLKNSLADGLHGSGPYHTIRPVEYFEHKNISGFNSEIGPSGVPVEVSLYEFLPDLGKTWNEGRFPLFSEWGYHDANERGKWDDRKFSFYDTIVREDYGPPISEDAAGVSDYALKCQLVNYDVYRAAVEAINQDLWTASSGFALWKVNAGWPSLTWQLLDWYQYAHAGYYAVKKACEPLHVQLNRDSLTVSVINSGPDPYKDLSLQAELLDLNNGRVWRKKEKIDSPSNQARESSWTVELPEDSALYMLNLKLKKGGKQLSDNNYWLQRENEFSGLFQMKTARLKTKTRMVEIDHQYHIEVEIKNRDAYTAFFIHFHVLDGASGEELRPVFWTDNYLTLLPKEKRKLSVQMNTSLFAGDPVIYWEGVNVEAGQRLINRK